MREIGTDSSKPIKEYADLMCKEEEIAPIEHSSIDYLENDEQVFLQSGVISLFVAQRYPKIKKYEKGTLLLTDRGLLFIKKNNGESIRYSFDTIFRRTTIKNFIFQIMFWSTKENGNKYPNIARFEMLKESCLKWEFFYDFTRKMAPIQ
jgi:hypothetical protein